MKIKNIDRNFAALPDLEDGRIIKLPSKDVSLFGLIYNRKYGFLRMPKQDSNKVSKSASYLSDHTAGGRLAFITNSRRIRINVSYASLEKMYHMPLTGQVGFSLLEVINGKEHHRYTFAPNFNSLDGYSSTSCVLPNKGERKYILYFPLYNKVKNLEIVIDKNSSIKPFNPYEETLPILYYGSSITQGGCASRPDNSYQSIISKMNHIDHINLGFSGNCRGEIAMAEYCGKIACSVFVYAYDNNAPSVDYLLDTHEKFFKTFRKYQPKTPVIMITATNYQQNPKEYALRRKIIYQTYRNAINSGDKNVYLLDGKNIFPSKISESCTVDGAHPNDLGFYFIAKSLLKLLKNIFK